MASLKDFGICFGATTTSTHTDSTRQFKSMSRALVYDNYVDSDIYFLLRSKGNADVSAILTGEAVAESLQEINDDITAELKQQKEKDTDSSMSKPVITVSSEPANDWQELSEDLENSKSVVQTPVAEPKIINIEINNSFLSHRFTPHLNFKGSHGRYPDRDCAELEGGEAGYTTTTTIQKQIKCLILWLWRWLDL